MPDSVGLSRMTAKAINYLFLLLSLTACAQNSSTQKVVETSTDSLTTNETEVPKLAIPAAENLEAYLPMLKGKTIGIVANQTSMVGQTHLIDTLISSGIDVKKVFAPEHGFRGNADAGEKVKNGKDKKTGLPILSLYGKNLKPSKAQMKGVDLVVFDIQDVGARFYTYISTMSYMMEACAEQGVPFMVLDRPNPNGHYVDGPILDTAFSSFVGMHPVPVVHGMTIGEYAQMVNGEGWLKNGIKCDLTVIEMENYFRDVPYDLPMIPSPNLPNQRSIYLYPSLCFFEGTIVSEGRGTDKPFQLFGYPGMPKGEVEFTPRSIEGASMYPKFKGEKCAGFDLSSLSEDSLRKMAKLNLTWLIDAYRNYKGTKPFFDPAFFDLLAGNDQLRKDLEAGKTEDEVRKSWVHGLEEFQKIRQLYLLYP